MARSASAVVMKKKRAIVSFVPAPANFVSAFYERLLPTDITLFSKEDRARIAASIWEFAAARRVGESRVRVFNPSREIEGWSIDHTVIEIVNDDMPFLVDSVTGVLQRRGLTVHIVIHPVLSVVRDSKGKATGVVSANAAGAHSESFMHIEIDHCIEPFQLKEIEKEVQETLTDVRAAVKDWGKMRDAMQNTIDFLTAPDNQPNTGEDIAEIRDFLKWLIDDNFTFLGYRDINLKQQADDLTVIQIVPGSGLGVLRNDEARMFGSLRDLDTRKNAPLRKYMCQKHVLFITKTNTVTRVHRVLPMDAVFVRRFNDEGVVTSERLFVGLFTAKTYTQTPRDIPFIRRKIANIFDRMGFAPQSHDGRRLAHILNTYPHGELFQISEEDLYTNVCGILQLQERARVAFFPRRDAFGRYVTCLLYVPRDHYNSTLRVRIQTFLEAAYQGKAQSWYVRLDDGRLARAFVTIHLTPDSPAPDAATLEEGLRDLCRTWTDHLRNSLIVAHGEGVALTLLRRYSDAFPEIYRDAVSPDQAVRDMQNLEILRAEPRFLATLYEAGDGRLILKLFNPGQPLSLSESLPLIENMGLKVDYMGGPYEIKFKDDAASIYVHEFVGKPAFALCVDFATLKPLFKEAITKVWRGEAEDDAFNALTLCAGLGWKEIVALRCFARYLRQLRIPYSHEMIAAAFISNPQITQKLCALFNVRHDPTLKGDRIAQMRALEAAIHDNMVKITVLEDDRIIRRYVNLIQSSLRTNFFQTDEKGAPKSYVSVKFDSRTVEFMPLPKPLYEIFVYSPMTEAVHLRGGKVARGGIRWSDRREDFRNEILGLMKAQMVKNSVIVPMGSKGGFIVKRPSGEADKFQAEGIACYTIMMQGLLDITDNRANGKITPPKNVVRHDGDDLYLVVAADKGTAKFSDIANGISRSYGFWLDDAFASGGSVGYDHKGMGITARGAWEAVKRHFRELGKDIQSESFTCIGVGDMSGDVFGNGLLLSKHTLLTGAFDHRHIFCDPTPDAAQSYAERQRMFVLPRSSWNDYDHKLLSKGGGIFARTEKLIKLSPEMKLAYGVDAGSLSPSDLIQAMLKAQVDLLYFGGIGTYVKASGETHEDVGDRANEALRINGRELRAKVIGEGANLGMTQRGRIEAAQSGVHLNTDAIDNSGGVDTSDHEVNIKILLRKAIDQKTLTFPTRDKLLASMTNEVGFLVLRDNYLQTQALTLAETQAVEFLPVHVRCMQIMEKTGLLNRAVEFLPDDADVAERHRSGKGLTRPELAVLLSYSKIWLYQKILDSDLPDDPALQSDLTDYFPKALRKVYAKDIAQHQLRREIAATVLTNDIVNHAGIDIILTMNERADPESVARAYLLAREVFALPEIWADIEALDNKVPAAVQTRLLITVGDALLEAMDRILADKNALMHLAPAIEANRNGLDQLGEWVARHAALLDESIHQAESDLTSKGVPAALSRRVSHFPVLVSAFDLIGFANKNKGRISDLASIFFALEKRLDIGWLSKGVVPLASQTSWQREAVGAALEDLASHHRRLTAQLANKKAKSKTESKTNGAQDVATWATHQAAKLERYDALLAEGRAAGVVDLAMLLLANARLNAVSA